MDKWFRGFRADEGTLSRLLVESSILLASSRGNPTTVLKDAATAYKVDTMLSPLRSGRSSPRRIRQRRSHSQQQKLRRRQLNYAYAEGRYAPSFCFLAPKIAQGETMLVSPCTLCPLILGRSPVALALREHRLTDSVLYQELCDVLVISNASQRAGGWEHLLRAVSQDHGSGLYKRREGICWEVLNPDARPNKLEVLSRIERIK